MSETPEQAFRRLIAAHDLSGGKITINGQGVQLHVPGDEVVPMTFVPLDAMSLYRALADGLLTIIEAADAGASAFDDRTRLHLREQDTTWLREMLRQLQLADPAGEPGATQPIFEGGE